MGNLPKSWVAAVRCRALPESEVTRSGELCHNRIGIVAYRYNNSPGGQCARIRVEHQGGQLSDDLTEAKCRQDLIDVAARCYEKGYICGLEGNFSIRLESNLILTTPRGCCKARLNKDELVLTDLEGNPIGEGKPSTELKMHLIVYKAREDVQAVVHAHPTTAVGLTIAGVDMTTPISPEVLCTVGKIPTAPYATPSTKEMPDSILPFLADHDALMLSHHGALALGPDIWDAFYKLETIEHFAQTLLVAKIAGGAIPLSEAHVASLMAIKHIYQKSSSSVN
jgi:L-fuculose-phosphate aldolase